MLLGNTLTKEEQFRALKDGAAEFMERINAEQPFLCLKGISAPVSNYSSECGGDDPLLLEPLVDEVVAQKSDDQLLFEPEDDEHMALQFASKDQAKYQPSSDNKLNTELPESKLEPTIDPKAVADSSQPKEIKPVQIPSPFLKEARKKKALDESRDTSPLEEEEKKKEKAAALKTPKPGPTGSKQPEPTPTFSDDGGSAAETPVKSSLDAPQQTVGVYGGFKKFTKETLMRFTKEKYSPQACAEARSAASPVGTYNAEGELLEEPKTKLKTFTESVPAQGANKSKPSA